MGENFVSYILMPKNCLEKLENVFCLWSGNLVLSRHHNLRPAVGPMLKLITTHGPGVGMCTVSSLCPVSFTFTATLHITLITLATDQYRSWLSRPVKLCYSVQTDSIYRCCCQCSRFIENHAKISCVGLHPKSVCSKHGPSYPSFAVALELLLLNIKLVILDILLNNVIDDDFEWTFGLLWLLESCGNKAAKTWF